MSPSARFFRPLGVTIGVAWALLWFNGLVAGHIRNTFLWYLDFTALAVTLALPFGLYAATVLARDPDPSAASGTSGWPDGTLFRVVAVSLLGWALWDLGLPFIEHLEFGAGAAELNPAGPEVPWIRLSMADSIASLGPMEYTLDRSRPYAQPPGWLRFLALQGFGLAVMTFVVGLIGLEIGAKAPPIRSRRGLRARFGLWLVVFAAIAFGGHVPFEIARRTEGALWFLLAVLPPVPPLLVLVSLRLARTPPDG
jgi:hypothetical protein